MGLGPRPQTGSVPAGWNTCLCATLATTEQEEGEPQAVVRLKTCKQIACL